MRPGESWFLAILLSMLFIPASLGAWYYNISIEATKSFLFNDIQINVNYTFYELGRTKRGLLVFEIENSTNLEVVVYPPLFNKKKFYLSPDHLFEKPLTIYSGQKLAFYTFTLPTNEKIIFNISGKNFTLPMNWTQKTYDEKRWNWFTIQVGRVSNLFFWISLILYISNRVRNI